MPVDNQYEKGATPQADDDAAKQEWERILDEAMNRAAVRAAARQTSASAKSDPWGVNGLLDTGHLPPMERQSRPVSAVFRLVQTVQEAVVHTVRFVTTVRI